MVVSGVQVATFKEQLGARGAVECVSSYVVVCKWLYGGAGGPMHFSVSPRTLVGDLVLGTRDLGLVRKKHYGGLWRFSYSSISN